MAVGFIILAAMAGGAWWAWRWIHEELVPLVETNLDELLGRPVELGAVERVGFDSIEFGASAVPATPTDPDRVLTEGVIVEFSLLQLLNRTLQLNVILQEPDIYVEQSADGRWVTTELQTEDEGEGGFLTVELQSIRLRDGELVLQPLPRPNLPDGAVQLGDVDGVARFLEDNELITFDVNGSAAQGGRLRLIGESRPGEEQTELTLRAQNFPAIAVSRVVELPIVLQSGRVDSNLTIQFQPQDDIPAITGTATLDSVNAQIAQIPQRFIDTNGRLRFRGETIAFDNLRTRYGEIPTQVEGAVNLETGYDLAVEVAEPIAIQTLLDTFEISAPVPLDGQLRANLQVQGALDAPVLTGVASTINTAEIDQVGFSEITTEFRLTTTGETPSLIFPTIRAIPQAGGRIIGNGRVNLGDVPNVAFTLQAINVPGDEIAQLYDVSPAITIGNVEAIARVTGTTDNIQTVVQFQLPGATYPGQGELVIGNGGNILLRDAVFNVADGIVEVAGQLTDGQLQATVEAAEVRLNQFSEDLRGRLSGTVQLAGSTENFQPSNLTAAGQVRFSEGLAVVQEPLTAQIRWTGEQLVVQQATAPGLLASGTIDVQLEGEGAPQISNFNLAVQAENYDLQDLGLGLPGNVALAGQADFDGQVTGTPTAPSAVGALQVQDLQVGSLAFDPLLTGRLNYQAGQRTDLQLSGQQDRIALTLGPNNRPLSFFVRQDQAIAQGTTQGDTLFVDLQQIPLGLVEGFIPSDALAVGPLSGDIFGELAVNLNTYAVEGDIAIAEPRIGRIAADLFRGRIQFAEGVVTLTEGIIQQGESQIALGGTIPIGQAQPVDFQISLDQVAVQTILQTLSLFAVGDAATGLQPPDLGDAADVQTVPIDVADLSILNQVRRFSAIRELLAQQRANEEETPLPTLAELEGTVTGNVTFTGVLETGLDIAFDLRGDDWIWGDYQIDQVVAEGSFADGVLTALPVRAEIGDGFIAFNGQVGAEQLSGQVRVRDVPVELFEPVLTNLPVEVDGQLNAIATLAGSLENPNLLGEVVLESAVLNDQPVERAQAIFGYENARFNFTSDILITGTEPIDIVGSIPIALPFAEVQPTTDQISIRANIADEGLALVNLFTDQVTWVEGQGQLDLLVGGTLSQPVIEGDLVVQDATLEAQLLEDPLTSVNGTVFLESNTLIVEQLQADYNDGQLVAEGAIPLFASQPSITDPLTVSLNDLTLNVNEFYEGGVSGDVILTGSALSPTIGGTIQLMDGEVNLANAGGGGADAEIDSEVDTVVDQVEPVEAEPVNDIEPGIDEDVEIDDEDLTIDDEGLSIEGEELEIEDQDLTIDEEDWVAIEEELAADEDVIADEGILDEDDVITEEDIAGEEDIIDEDPVIDVATEPPPIAFDDLQIVLGDDVRVTNEPVLSFEVEGDLTLNGTFADLRPDGVLQLTGGQVNLFTTQFVLDRSAEQTIVFTPEAGLDPILDIQLFALVPEVAGGGGLAAYDRSPISPQSNEIAETPDFYGTVRTIRVEASITGPASELSDNLELSSDPDRSESEIVALLGGRFLDVLAANPALGAATIAGSALFGGDLQALITELGQAIGLSELRVFPTFISENNAATSSRLGLAVEGIVDLTSDFSVSVAGVVGAEDPIRYSVIYQINDEILLRTSTDLAGDSRAVIQYQTRF
ncbi:MAG: translocation/assembly module TamB domain-containing protein [Elainellaceae cyanobacterium]